MGRIGRIALTSLRAGMLLFAAVWPACAGTPSGNYLLHCQGCHKADGSGQPGYVPDFRGSAARFLAIPAGRAYLGRVPGTAQSLLDDASRAAVLNWIVSTFDRVHVPADFAPYTAAEMALYRRAPLSQASAERNRLALLIPAASPATTAGAAATASAAAAQPPRQFEICAACHPTSSDGASAMGPNLRGVMGRRAGTLAGYSYSAAMKASGIVWTPASLDDYLSDVQRKIPGTLMTLTGLPDAGDRAAVIAYLEAL
jgi:cytochrome c2